MSQLNLPGMDNDVQLVPASDRPEPVVWIERLVVVDRRHPATTVRREVSFRRGLNVIRTEQRQPGERNTVGHDVGKTLLTRLIRYLLGRRRSKARQVGFTGSPTPLAGRTRVVRLARVFASRLSRVNRSGRSVSPFVKTS